MNKSPINTSPKISELLGIFRLYALTKKVLEDNNEKWGAMLHRALRIEHQVSRSWCERSFL